MNEARLPHRDRREAGRVVAQALQHYRGRSGLLVLALPRGGAAVGLEVARALEAPLDVRGEPVVSRLPAGDRPGGARPAGRSAPRAGAIH